MDKIISATVTFIPGPWTKTISYLNKENNYTYVINTDNK